MKTPPKKSGLALVEVIVAAAMLLIVAASIGKFLAALSVQRQAADAQRTALRALDNFTQEVQAQPWESIDDNLGEQLQVPSEVAKQLPNAKVRAAVSLETEPVESKRVTLHLSWGGPRLPRESSVALTTWVFPAPEMQP
jgi:type II secretory pathway pseudopilin PulG